MKWKFFPLVLFCALLSSISTIAAETESNNSSGTADTIAVNGSHSAAINSPGDVDWYILTTNSDGRITVNLTTGSAKYLTVSLYDANSTSLLKSGSSNASFQVVFDGAAAGKYFVKVAATYAADIPAYTIGNTLTVPVQGNDVSQNNTKAAAMVLNQNATTTGHIGYSNNQVRDSADWFKLTTNGDGVIKLSLVTGNGQTVYMYLYDNNGTTQLGYSSGSSGLTFSTDGLAAGTYYILIKPSSNTAFAPYSLTDSLLAPLYSNDTEPNNSFDKAVVIPLNANKKGHTGYYYNLKRDSADWFKVTTLNNGQLRLKCMPGNNQYVNVSLYDTNAVTLLKSASANTPFYITRDGLAPGTYFIKVNAFYGNGYNSYSLTDSFYTAIVSGDVEPNNTVATAHIIDLNSSKTGQVGYYYNNQRDSIDWYKITTNADGLVRLKLKSGNATSISAYLYDLNGTTQLAYGNGTDSFYLNMDGLASGTYYVKIRTTAADAFAPYTLTDSLIIPSEANDTEPNNSFANAIPLVVNATVKGHSGYYYNLKRDSSDWYKVVTTEDGLMKINVKPGNTQYLYAYLYDANGTTLLKSLSGNSAFSLTMDGLAAGTYFIKVAPYYGNGFSPYTLTDSLVKVPVSNDIEINNTPSQAQVLNLNSVSNGHIGYYHNLKRDTTDWFKITTGVDGAIIIKLEATNAQNIKAELFDKDAIKSLKFASGSGTVILKADGLAPNTYYLKVNSYYTSGFQGYKLTDSLLTYSYSSDAEPDNKPYQAIVIPSRASATGHVGFYANSLRDTCDWYKINYSGTTNILKFGLDIEAKKSDGSRAYVWCYIYRDTSQPAIFSKYYNGASNSVSVNAVNGTYFVKVIPYYNYDFASYAIIDSNNSISNVNISVVNAVPSNNCLIMNSLQYNVSNGIYPYTLQLYRYGQPYGNPVSITSGFTFNNLPPGVYFARAYSFGATGNAYTQSVNTSLVPIPSGPSARIVTNTSVMLKWAGYTCVKYYQVQYRDKIVGSWATLKTQGNKDSIAVSGLIANNTYQFKVSAIDSGNNIIAYGTYSPVAEFTTTLPVQSSFAPSGTVDPKTPDLRGIVQVYPNPATYSLTILLKGNEGVQLSDLNGKVVWSGKGNGNQVMHINVSGLIPGVYILRLFDMNGKETIRKVLIGK